MTRIFLRATAVTQEWNSFRNNSQHRKLSLEKKILLPLLQGFEPVTFQSWVQHCNHWAIPTPRVWMLAVTFWSHADTTGRQKHGKKSRQETLSKLSDVAMLTRATMAHSDVWQWITFFSGVSGSRQLWWSRTCILLLLLLLITFMSRYSPLLSRLAVLLSMRFQM